METWPSTLPQDLNRSFNVSLLNGQADPQEQINPIRTRTHPEYKGSFTVLMTQAQMQLFLTFYESTLNYGCKDFTADWLTSAGFADYFAIFLAPPTMTYKQTLWSVKMNLTIMYGG